MHRPHSHDDHVHHDHSDPGHGHASSRTMTADAVPGLSDHAPAAFILDPPVWSLVSASLAVRLLIAAVLSGTLWAAVLLAMR